jgi:hypothetical protein
MGFQMTPSEKFTNWEKVLLPFDEEIWKFLVITFGLAFSSVFLVNRMPKYFKNLVFGEGIKIPAYNILGTFFGIGQLKLPEGNFARILLMIFILFCLIVRTAYQGKFYINIGRTLLNRDPVLGVLFEMMTKEIHKKPPETIEDLYNRNFTIISVNASWSWELLTGMIPENHRPKILNYSTADFNQFLRDQLYNESEKFAVFLMEQELFRRAKGVQLKEVLFTDTVGIMTGRNQFIFRLTEETLRDLISGGIPQHIYKFHMDMVFPPNSKDDLGPSVLGIDDLNYGFVIWIVAIVITLLAFIAELCMKFFIVKLFNRIKKNLRKLLGIILVIDWLRNYLKSVKPLYL